MSVELTKDEEWTKTCKDIAWSEMTRSDCLNAECPMVNLSSPNAKSQVRSPRR